MNTDPTPTRKATVEDGLSRLPTPDGKRFVTLFKHGTLLVELYAPRGTDPQKPHTRDEVYIVAEGAGEFVCAGTRMDFKRGDFLFAAAGEEHRFENFTHDTALWVLFYGPEGGEQAAVSEEIK
ncbi:MAG TPA: cupin domain-containing protein [Blastocatellia bacterium]|nr:cupin domain-containing protein [Blastocatellia bacterium]